MSIKFFVSFQNSKGVVTNYFLKVQYLLKCSNFSFKIFIHIFHLILTKLNEIGIIFTFILQMKED